MRPSTKLRQLLRRKNKVLAVLGAPNAFHAKIMEANGVEACFVGTSITGGNYTGLPDLGILSMTECVAIAKWIARSVKIPVILDGDTGHGGIMAVRRWRGSLLKQVSRVCASTISRWSKSGARCLPAFPSFPLRKPSRATARRWTQKTRSIPIL